MKICIAQTKSEKGKVPENISIHLSLIQRAIQFNADLIIFPELSITNYESELANKLARELEDPIFDPFQKIADKHDISIGIGMPLKVKDGIHISMVIFQPNKARIVYCKQTLHRDELPYFISGKESALIEVKEKKIAIGICYESLQREHFLRAHQDGADIYIASVAKPKSGIEKAYQYFPETAKAFETPILMVNVVGHCDNFMSMGQSAVWNTNGILLDHLDEKDQGLLFYDTITESTQTEQLTIEKGKLNELENLVQIYIKGKLALEQNSIYQWTDTYPNRSIIESDIKKGVLYALKNKNKIIGAININEEQSAEYAQINWLFNDQKVLVVHRLVIDPNHQKKGYARVLMDFAEKFAKEQKYTSIRLDAFTKHERVVEFYHKRNFIIRGEVNFPGRSFPFYCMEKEILTNSLA